MTDPAQYESWLDSGFAWLQENWVEQEWSEVLGGFLAALGLAGAADDPVVHALVAEIEVLPAEDQRATVLDAGARAELVQHALGAGGERAADGSADAAAPAAAPASDATDAAAEVEPVYVEGTGWMRWDPDTQAWVATEAEAPAAASSAAAPAPAASPAAGESPDAAAPPAAEPAQEPAQVAAQVAEQIVLPALTEALAAAPQLAELSAEELNRLMSEVLAERLAAAG
jgi:hypothetical protein